MIKLVNQIYQTHDSLKGYALKTINMSLTVRNWLFGLYIVEYEQGGLEKPEYGSNLLDRLSKDLTMMYGKGFSRSNLFYIRSFYVKFSKIQTVFGQFSATVSHKLSWGHYIQILKSDNELEIKFYTKQCEKENWSVRELKRQMNSMLFHRLALSKDKAGVLAIAEKGIEIQKPEDIIKEPFVVEFFGIPHQERYLEGDLEEKLIQNLELFMLELGKGFAFVKRQYRIPVGNRQFSVDLVFYNIIIMVEYAMNNINNHLFVSKYQLFLPDKEQLENELKKIIEEE